MPDSSWCSAPCWRLLLLQQQMLPMHTHTHTQRGSNFTSVRLQLSVISGVKGRCIGRGKLQAHHRCNTAQPLDQVIPAKPNLEGRIRRVIQFLFFNKTNPKGITKKCYWLHLLMTFLIPAKPTVESGVTFFPFFSLKQNQPKRHKQLIKGKNLFIIFLCLLGWFCFKEKNLFFYFIYFLEVTLLILQLVLQVLKKSLTKLCSHSHPPMETER